ncbi:hypothetical protein EDC18_103349 [Natranaerovirga pectinivora]|uniref:Uncharacterized protein n=1 Tax=Natranaerovirga pectinivora TaxID=682400 RepID=A0A4R3MR46_9FIRM|nr:hypothetical protein [Natranaerovirga pectinivora]TCT15641.1 hypothetical protein EDC18_103349 [Natranaerovirga pectinivora]
MFISLTELFLFLLAFVMTLFLIFILQKKAGVNGQVLHFSFGEKEHLRNLQSKIFIFAIPLFIGFLTEAISEVMSVDSNIFIISVIPTGLAFMFTISTLFFVPHLLIKPLQERLLQTRVLYLFIVIIYSIFSGVGALIFSAFSKNSVSNDFVYSLLQNLLFAFILWVIGFTVFLISQRTYRGINVSYEKKMQEEFKQKNDDADKEYIIMQELSRILKETVISAYASIQEEVAATKVDSEEKRLHILNSSLMKRVKDLEYMLEIAEKNSDIKKFKESFNYIGYLPKRLKSSRVDFYNNDYVKRSGYFG